MTAPSSAATPAGGGPAVTVHLPNCPACSVLATHAAVAGSFSAALVDLGGHRAALVSVKANGLVSSAAKIPYGATFAAPADHRLPCDAGGRCIVIAAATDGHAVASALFLDRDGTWQDVSIPGGFISSTDQAQVIELDGELGIAVQDGAAATLVWTVYRWADGGYTVAGCEPAAVRIDPAGLSLDHCDS